MTECNEIYCTISFKIYLLFKLLTISIIKMFNFNTKKENNPLFYWMYIIYIFNK